MLNLSDRIDLSTVAVYEAIAKAAAASGISFFVVGATARDMLLKYAYGMDPKRGTVDVDIGIHVQDWDAFDRFKSALTESSQFESTQVPQRVRYERNLPVDIVPFGEIEEDPNEIRWPPGQAIIMNVLGFDDAYKSAELVRLREAPTLDVRFATLSGLVILKFIAWKDRLSRTNKDALDLAYIMQVYLDAGNQERLREEHSDLLDDDNFDYVIAGSRLLGRDIAEIISPTVRAKILAILDDETGNQQQYRLVEAMIRGSTGEESEFEKHLQLLEEFKRGITESV